MWFIGIPSEGKAGKGGWDGKKEGNESRLGKPLSGRGNRLAGRDETLERGLEWAKRRGLEKGGWERGREERNA